MTSFADLAGDITDTPDNLVVATPRKSGKSFFSLAGGGSGKKPADSAPTFTTNDPATMRAQFVALNRPDLVAAFDEQFPPQTAVAGRGINQAPARNNDFTPSAPGSIPRIELSGMANGQNPAAQPASPETPLSNVLHGAASLADNAWNAVPGVIGSGVYALARANGETPDDSTKGANMATGWALNPFGKAFGIQDTPGYKNEASRKLMDFVGQNVGKGADWISQNTGLPKTDVENMIGTLTMAAPAAFGALRKGAKSLPGAVSDASSQLRSAFSEKQGPVPVESRVEPIMGKPRYKLSTDGSMATVASPVAQVVEPATVAPGRPMIGGADTVRYQSNPYPDFAGQEGVRGVFPQVKLEKNATDVALPEQQSRVQIATEINPNGQVREGVKTGNEQTLRSEYTMAKHPDQSPANAALSEQIAAEQRALPKYAQERVNQTGADPTMQTDYERGQRLNDAIYGESSLTSYIKDAKQQVFDKAREVSGDNPIKTSHVDALLQDPQFQSGLKLTGNTETAQGVQGLIDLARNQGFRHPVTGEILKPSSVAAWDGVRKYLNSKWNNGNKYVIRDINGAIDQDIAAAGGSELYKTGDRIHQAEQNLLHNSKGISSVFGEPDANGVQTGVDFSKLPSKLNSLPLDQWRHIDSTLEELSRGQVRGAPDGMPTVPPEVMQSAAKARAELHGALAREVYEQGGGLKGGWNSNNVNNTLNGAVGEKIRATFSPDEIKNFHTLNIGGQIMPGVHPYEGAALQGARVANPGLVEKYAPKLGSWAGAAVGSVVGPKGTVVGHMGGEAIGNKLGAKAQSSRLSQEGLNLISKMKDNASK